MALLLVPLLLRVLLVHLQILRLHLHFIALLHALPILAASSSSSTFVPASSSSSLSAHTSPSPRPSAPIRALTEPYALLRHLDVHALAERRQTLPDARELGRGQCYARVLVCVGDAERVGVDVHQLRVLFGDAVKV
ncbi:hypothetical protein FIBSPDRAFT_901474 [Athelia psychrophila]|uniref:Uncharacterized protein n=1 Tax=Athelia psychrophila TaxID=1759441 RepID=A0A165X3J3_9AGAM|nr:hypothetical protein FIBSPDRAFT_901474 [Fibularhizoctonia sp. CBS 109695]